MTHQVLREYVEWDYENQKPIYRIIDTSEWKLIQEWTFTHHGVSPRGSTENWHEYGSIILCDSEGEDVYLEASIKGVPFFSILSTIDQWGTWHTFKLTGDGVRSHEESGTVTYAQEWGNPSFLESLGQAMIKLAEWTEPDHVKYNEKEAMRDEIWRRNDT